MVAQPSPGPLGVQVEAVMERSWDRGFAVRSVARCLGLSKAMSFSAPLLPVCRTGMLSISAVGLHMKDELLRGHELAFRG